MVDDLAALAASVAPVAGTAITFVASPACYAKVKMRLPTFAWAVFPSGAMSANQIALFASNALVFAVDPTPSIDAATGTAVHMSDTPTALVASGTADPIRSTRQSDAIALRLTMSANWGLAPAGPSPSPPAAGGERDV